MSNCGNCKHKNDGCYCPPDKRCTAYEKKERHVTEHIFKFNTWDDWTPCGPACRSKCPFSNSIPLDESCRFLNDESPGCPFLVCN